MPEPIRTDVPPLETGDHLTRPEFERRYKAMPHVKKAELIDGTVFMPSPTRFQRHGQPHAFIMSWLGSYVALTPGITFADNATVRLDLDNEVQPDALLRLPTEAGGTSRITDDDYLEGAPELIVEIAGSSAAYDLHDKRTLYRRHGVQEYVVWQIFEQRIDWFVLEDGAYLALDLTDDGHFHSRVFPGLCLATEAMLKGDLATVLDSARTCADTSEHAAFIQRLRDASV
ncbi:MAG: Uma2 family endonuclease [Bacteroidetes bacterium]|jgi:Uma2 family endonuclease|nr:Uma2 family endonuclease [Bacteroidota bacterium]